MKKVILFFVVLILSLKLEAQCAMCRAVLETEDGQSTAEGINNGILYLMVVPYLLIGGLSFYLYRSLREK
ncbi:MAG: hypothetical protein P8O09_00335 [Flavobacteriaceae bacterium]|nr:hypothetical protein [Flavobacteriaceae bacterium]